MKGNNNPNNNRIPLWQRFGTTPDNPFEDLIDNEYRRQPGESSRDHVSRIIESALEVASENPFEDQPREVAENRTNEPTEEQQQAASNIQRAWRNRVQRNDSEQQNIGR